MVVTRAGEPERAQTVARSSRRLRGDNGPAVPQTDLVAREQDERAGDWLTRAVDAYVNGTPGVINDDDRAEPTEPSAAFRDWHLAAKAVLSERLC